MTLGAKGKKTKRKAPAHPESLLPRPQVPTASSHTSSRGAIGYPPALTVSVFLWQAES